MAKLKIKKKTVYILIITLLVLIGLIVFLITRKPNISKFIIGSWTTPGGTIYTFNKDKTGVMKVPLHEYEFTYKFADEKIIIDYKDENANDPVYEYSIEGNTITLKGENGTFTFNKVIEKNKK